MEIYTVSKESRPTLKKLLKEYIENEEQEELF